MLTTDKNYKIYRYSDNIFIKTISTHKSSFTFPQNISDKNPYKNHTRKVVHYRLPLLQWPKQDKTALNLRGPRDAEARNGVAPLHNGRVLSLLKK